ncbi:hypothetical protein EV140_0190 [Microcella alkaliphila]|uniref:Integral membrane protein n=1 Tax=Microcella alkaliphila TaxID=279828 RepID=A0A0U5BVS2_9MICO|nr:hypothetical protein [Microcella alkaliphila]RZT63960.1 hypothetical protein EV140_0190 [Microcella alkaliphila]BAU32557.1 uncharacterized protein MalAC0309_1709 [Microcella alkaliphila]
MIEWFSFVQIGVATLVGLIALVFGAMGRRPDDVTVLGSALVALLLIAQIVVGIVQPLVGNDPTGDIVEWWLYLIVALLLVVAGVVWALIDRTRWATIILGVVAVTVAVMVYRMNQIWFVQTVGGALGA